MQTVQLSKDKVLKAYAAGKPDEKKLMETLLGKELFLPKVIDRIKTYEQACKATKRNPVKSIPFSKPKDSYEVGMNAMGVMLIFAEALQGDWKADYNDANQQKHFPIFKYESKKAGFGFSHSDFDFVFSYTPVGSRLCFPTAELAEYFAVQIIKVINQFLNK